MLSALVNEGEGKRRDEIKVKIPSYILQIYSKEERHFIGDVYSQNISSNFDYPWWGGESRPGDGFTGVSCCAKIA